ncbi:hypothetical protein NDU88_006527 [Pleurodeles waltl]|uniref:Uncharacterized protein n=1 Tax=Pleurodeles waltl TaxID=8319 RepID=A0AAV7VM55_PLEWA|nr:hypothetical protein NDU88_006527 [Pleurodeles waltl]
MVTRPIRSVDDEKLHKQESVCDMDNDDNLQNSRSDLKELLKEAVEAVMGNAQAKKQKSEPEDDQDIH